MKLIKILLAALICAATFGCGEPDTPPPLTTVLDADLHFVRTPANDLPIGATVLLLHGASYTTDIWHETGVATALTDAGIDVVAVDLPGFGHSTETAASDADMLRAIIDNVGRQVPVFVVSPSMSGRFSLPLLATDGSAALGGFVAVAPVGVEQFVASVTDPIDVPALVIWGADDDVVDPAQASKLASAFGESQIAILDGAGHAAYVDQPDAFVDAVVAFIHETGLPTFHE